MPRKNPVPAVSSTSFAGKLLLLLLLVLVLVLGLAASLGPAMMQVSI